MTLIIGIIIIIVFIHFLIIKPLTQRQSNRNIYNDRSDYYGPNPNGIGGWNGMSGTGMGRFGTFAGGLATGALLTYLFEQGRIGFDQFQLWQNLGDHELLRELEDQNILQQNEIDQLREQVDGQDIGDNTNDWNSDIQDPNSNGVDYNPSGEPDNSDLAGWDNNSDGGDWL